MRRRLLPLIPLAVLLAACAPATDSGAGGAATASASASPTCRPDTLQTLSPGKLTFGTDQPVYEPWFVDDKPENGKGFEGAVAAAVATQLGYAPSAVTWTRVPFNAAIQPGPKKYDIDINEFSITPARRKAVDFSAPYYDVSQAVIALKSSPAATAKTLADLKDLQLGAQVGTTSYSAITDVVRPNKPPRVYNTNDDAKTALQNGQIDGLVLDLPTAFYVTAAEVQGSTIVGQLPPGGGKPEQFGLVLDKGSALTACVSAAVDALRGNGTLDRLEQQWLSKGAGAPVLE